MQHFPFWAWAGFLLFVAAMLAVDLGVFHRHTHEVRMREALAWCVVWVGLALAFNTLVYLTRGPKPALEFVTGYLVELSLSVDNVFVFILIFAFFRVPRAYHHRVLFWGILGAVVTRALFIGAGIALLSTLEWVLYLFGAFLIFSGIKFARAAEPHVEPDHNPIVRLFRRFFPVAPGYDGARFFTTVDGRRLATPLFIVLLTLETTDVVFAVDSIPAILAITRDGFIVFTSNIFAVLGLRAFYFALSGAMQMFRFLSYGLAAVLVLIGTKMLLSHYYEPPIEYSLGAIAGILLISVILSVLFPEKPKPPPDPR